MEIVGTKIEDNRKPRADVGLIDFKFASGRRLIVYLNGEGEGAPSDTQPVITSMITGDSKREGPESVGNQRSRLTRRRYSLFVLVHVPSAIRYISDSRLPFSIILSLSTEDSNKKRRWEGYNIPDERLLGEPSMDIHAWCSFHGKAHPFNHRFHYYGWAGFTYESHSTRKLQVFLRCCR